MTIGTPKVNSVTGQEVINTTIENETKQIDVSKLNNGIYIYTVLNQNGEAVTTNKLIIHK